MNKQMPKWAVVAAIANTLVLGCLPAWSADHPVNQQWKDQETWIQFTEKETGGGFKMSRPRPVVKPDSVLHPVVEAAGKPEPAAEPKQYLLLPPDHSAATPPPVTTVETMVVPVVQPTPFNAPYLGGGNYWGLHRNYWGAGTFGLPGFRGPVFTGPLGGPAAFGYKQRRTIQVGPSKASGNYFNPSTADPTASGNYFAPGGNAPRAVPVYTEEQPPADYWGKQGSPLPTDMRPD